MMRKATEADVPAFKKIWKTIFCDSDNFINWFFNKRFSCDMTFVYEKNGEIASLMHTYPLEIKLGPKAVSAVMVSGVTTLPEHRGQGLMHELFLYAIQSLAEKGHCICYYYPANPDFYKSLGHVNITENLVFENVSAFSGQKEFSRVPLEPVHISEIKIIYEKFMKEYSGFATRQIDFETKMQEYIGENLYIAINKTAYIIYKPTHTSVEIAELGGRFGGITELLCSFDRPINGKFPCDFPTEQLSGNICKAYGNMCGVTDVKKLLKETQYQCPLLVEIVDDVIHHNNGVFDFKGKEHNEKADVTLTTGQLLQTVSGYKVHPALKDYFTEYNCFTQDLY